MQEAARASAGSIESSVTGSSLGPGGGREIDSLTRRVDTSFGFSLLVEPGDYSSGLILRDGVFEIPETDLVTRLVRPGDVCIDGGCHTRLLHLPDGQTRGSSGRVYAFDANPWCCQRTKQNLALNGMDWVEVIHAALGNEQGTTSFYVSTDDQTGLSSLGAIERRKEIISVPWLRLEDFLDRKAVKKVRLLKLDVEGAETFALMGLGKVLTQDWIDFVLLECYDERLRLLKCSTEDVAKILGDAGYVPWEYGVDDPSGWSRTESVQSRDDCDYLFASPAIQEMMPQCSLAEALRRASSGVEKQQDDLDWLNTTLRQRKKKN